MSRTTERILIVIFLIVAVLLAMRDAHARMFGKVNPYAFAEPQPQWNQHTSDRDSASQYTVKLRRYG